MQNRIDELLETTKLNEYKNGMAGDLPRGIQQRLAFAVALIHDPEMVFLDEPTGGVDPALRRYFWDLIADLSEKGKTILVTSHYMDEVERCDYISFIYAGRLIAGGSPTELKKEYLEGTAYSLSADKRIEALESLMKIEGAVNPFPAGENVRFIVRPGGPGPGDIKKQVEKDGIKDVKIEKSSPTLEDVFVSLVLKREEKAESQ